MTKAGLIDVVAAGAEISKSTAGKAIDSFTEAIAETLKKGDKVSLTGFGTFTVSERKARIGRNPRTGESINIPASKSPKFSAGKTFKEAIK
jgi:DNA-binding protein HU-beta